MFLEGPLLFRQRTRMKKLFIGCLFISIICSAAIYRILTRPRYKYETDYVKLATSPQIPDAAYMQYSKSKTSVALALAITTRSDDLNRKLEEGLSRPNIVTGLIKELPLFTDLLPSFCLTGSKGFIYSMFLAFDIDDPILSQRLWQGEFHNVYNDELTAQCPESLRPVLHLLQCNHSGQPARAQNDAAVAAYNAGVEFIYRINDDTFLLTEKWTEAFITSLYLFNPPLVGVVGPVRQAIVENHYILTYEFVHRSHVAIFGFHYPNIISTWFADDWISHVYQPGRSVCLTDIKVQHTQSKGQRYNDKSDVLKKLDAQITHDKLILQKWLSKHMIHHTVDTQ